MKKTILYLITSLVILSSCEKEDDILQPIPTNPTQTTTTTTNNADTIIAHGDTIIINNPFGDTTTTYTPIGVTVIPTDQHNFVGYNNGLYLLTNCEFVMTKLSNSPETHLDTSYTYSYNETECISSPGQQNLNGMAVFGSNSGFESFVIPADLGSYPNHTGSLSTYPKPTSKTTFEGTNLTYTNGVLTMDLEFTLCGTSGTMYCTTSFDVVQYSDNSFDLIIDIPPRLCSPIAGNQFTPFTWKSHTKLHFEKQ